MELDAAVPLDEATSDRIRRETPDLVIPTRWVRTNKAESAQDAFHAKSRLVVQGFKDRSLGQYRRDAPTASSLAEALVLLVLVQMGFSMSCGDVKNAYFSGKALQREIYMAQPREGPLPGLRPRQLLRANKAIYGFAEAARMFWLALCEALEADGWQQSRLEPALFYLRSAGKLVGIMCTHVDDLLAGVHPSWSSRAFAETKRRLNFSKWALGDFTFRGRELKKQRTQLAHPHTKPPGD